MRSIILTVLLVIVLLASVACTPQARTLTVLAAASLNESFNELGALFETQNPGVKVSFSYGGSQQLAQQLGQGSAADLFASASTKYMDAAVASKRITKADARSFARNRLVVIFPKDNLAGLESLVDLAKPGLKLDLADKTVPAGQYTLDFLDKADKDPAFNPTFKANVVSYEDNVKAIVTKVSLGEADAGIVYVTDVTAASAAKIGKLEIPDALNILATYPIAPITDSKNPDLAKAFIALVLSPDGQAILAKYGFIPASGN
jgi:molybdate transport system substrate-binding protein